MIAISERVYLWDLVGVQKWYFTYIKINKTYSFRIFNFNFPKTANYSGFQNQSSDYLVWSVIPLANYPELPSTKYEQYFPRKSFGNALCSFAGKLNKKYLDVEGVVVDLTIRIIIQKKLEIFDVYFLLLLKEEM
jgi:hypothetical protein